MEILELISGDSFGNLLSLQWVSTKTLQFPEPEIKKYLH